METELPLVTNTYAEAKARVARLLLASPIAAKVGHPDSPNRLNAVLIAAEGGADRDVFYNLDFHDLEAKTRCTFHLTNTYDEAAGFRLDVHGNWLESCSIRLTMSWPNHGTMDAKLGSLRSRFYNEVSDVVAACSAVLEEMGPTWTKMMFQCKSTSNGSTTDHEENHRGGRHGHQGAGREGSDLRLVG